MPFSFKPETMKTLNPQIEALLETMQEQFLQIKQYESHIPQIELDILLANLRKTYEFVTKLNKINQKEEVQVQPVSSVKKDIFTPAPAVKSEPVIAKKENTLKVGSTTLPFDVPVTNTVKREMLPLFEPFKEAAKGLPIQEVKTEEISARKESQLKLRSTTLPFDIPAVNTFKKENTPAAPEPAKEPVTAALPEVKAEEIKASAEPELKAESRYEIPVQPSAPVKDTTFYQEKTNPFETNAFVFDIPNITEFKEEPVIAFIEPKPVVLKEQEPFIAETPLTVIPEIAAEKESPAVVFELAPSISSQEVLNISREKIYKEESFVQKMNPLPKIASLFEDTTVAVQEMSRESFSILDKFMKKKEDTSLAERLKHTPISDLKTAIGVNEKFQYINELFNGNYEDFNASLDLLNKCRSFTDAEIFIAENLFDKYNWQIDNKSVATFMDLVERRFL